MISRESQEYIGKFYESPAFGASGFFDPNSLPQGMATRREPTNAAIQCIPTNIGDIPCERKMLHFVQHDIFAYDAFQLRNGIRSIFQ